MDQIKLLKHINQLETDRKEGFLSLRVLKEVRDYASTSALFSGPHFLREALRYSILVVSFASF